MIHIKMPSCESESVAYELAAVVFYLFIQHSIIINVYIIECNFKSVLNVIFAIVF